MAEAAIEEPSARARRNECGPRIADARDPVPESVAEQDCFLYPCYGGASMCLMCRCPSCHKRLPLIGLLWRSASHAVCPYCHSELQSKGWDYWVAVGGTMISYYFLSFAHPLGRAALSVLAGILAMVIFVWAAPNAFQMRSPPLSILRESQLGRSDHP
jgi:hypothetical protein